MKLKLRILIFGLVLIAMIYNSKRGYYNKKVAFYNEEITSIIVDIKKTRGTKVYYGQDEAYFYLEAYKGIPLKKGDSIIKIGPEITIYRKLTNRNIYKLKGEGQAIEQSSYFTFFFS